MDRVVLEERYGISRGFTHDADTQRPMTQVAGTIGVLPAGVVCANQGGGGLGPNAFVKHASVSSNKHVRGLGLAPAFSHLALESSVDPEATTVPLERQPCLQARR